MGTYLTRAAAIRRRAIDRGRTSLARAGGLAALLPFGIFVPYLVIGVRQGPEVDVPTALRWIGLALVVAGPAFSYWSASTLGKHFDLDVEGHVGHEIVGSGPYRSW